MSRSSKSLNTRQSKVTINSQQLKQANENHAAQVITASNEHDIHPEEMESEEDRQGYGGADDQNSDQMHLQAMDEHGDQMDDQQYDQAGMCMCSAMQDPNELETRNPKQFLHFPSCWMHKIIPAGRVTYKSESVYNIIHQ